MKTSISILISAVLGIIIGILGTHSILNGSWANLLVWGVVGLLIGVFIIERRLIPGAGISYGIFLSLSFLISGFQGSADHILGFVMLTCVLTCIGAFCGWCLVFVGNWLKRIVGQE